MHDTYIKRRNHTFSSSLFSLPFSLYGTFIGPDRQTVFGAFYA